MKFRKLKKIYNEKYNYLPDSYDDQLKYLITKTGINESDIKDEIERITSIQWEEINMSFPIIPYPTPRPRSSSNGIFYVEGARENWNYMKQSIESKKVISTAVIFRVDCYFPIPDTMNRKEKILAQMGYIKPLSGGDWDNLGKTYSDAIQQILIINDNIIIDGRCTKNYCIKPRVDIHIEYQLDYDCSYNRRKIESTVSYKKLIQK